MFRWKGQGGEICGKVERTRVMEKRWRDGKKGRNGKRGGSVVCFITVNPDTAAFSAHMDWIIGYVGCSGTV